MVNSLLCQAEQRVGGKWVRLKELHPFDGPRDTGLLAFLGLPANDRSGVPPIAGRRGLPADMDKSEGNLLRDATEGSWLLLSELTAFDYDATFDEIGGMTIGSVSAEDYYAGRRATLIQKPGTTYREFLGPDFFHQLEVLKANMAGRIVFGRAA